MSNKFNAKKVRAYGMEFDSRKEFLRYAYLRSLLNQGRIRDLECQVEYTLIPKMESGGKAVRACKYIADFRYKDALGEKTVVEDVKGYRKGAAYEVFKIKKKLMLWLYGIEVKEV